MAVKTARTTHRRGGSQRPRGLEPRLCGMQRRGSPMPQSGWHERCIPIRACATVAASVEQPAAWKRRTRCAVRELSPWEIASEYAELS
eukprot:2918112-Prymnesium_polylepis.1